MSIWPRGQRSRWHTSTARNAKYFLGRMCSYLANLLPLVCQSLIRHLIQRSKSGMFQICRTAYTRIPFYLLMEGVRIKHNACSWCVVFKRFQTNHQCEIKAKGKGQIYFSSVLQLVTRFYGTCSYLQQWMHIVRQLQQMFQTTNWTWPSSQKSRPRLLKICNMTCKLNSYFLFW